MRGGYRVEADMEMHEIKYFLAACRTLNFHRAAELSHVSQPALTRAVQKLEAELGGHLFHRERNQIGVTDFGRLMRSHLEQVLRQTDTAKVAAKSFLKLEAAPLTLGVMCTIGPLRFVGFLNDFREQHPGIEVSVIENVPGRLSELLLGGTLDIALMAQPSPFDARLDVAPIFRERFGLAFPVGHRFEQRNTLHVTDVRGENYLSRINCEYRDYLGELCSRHGVEIRRAYRSEREDWIMAMVAAGMGICFLPEFSAVHPGVRHRPVAEPEVVREVSLVSVADRPFSPAVSAFVKAVREYDWAAGATSAGGLARKNLRTR
jgi:LysR family transcriptional regulator, hydrogen peroxide-inducible genes activator